MSRAELARLGRAVRDPALVLVLLLPLALLHLAARPPHAPDAFSLVEQALAALGAAGEVALIVLLTLALLWGLGRIRLEGVPWRGGAALAVVEGCLWGAILGPALHALTHLLPLESAPLGIASSAEGGALEALAVAAGAGLYEELLFRGIALGGGMLLLRMALYAWGWPGATRRLAFVLAWFLSSALFAWAHVYGDPQALEPQILAFRFLAGLVFGGLYAVRGLAVAAYAHFSYDAILLLA